jgi:hypothetical protein
MTNVPDDVANQLNIISFQLGILAKLMLHITASHDCETCRAIIHELVEESTEGGEK